MNNELTKEELIKLLFTTIDYILKYDANGYKHSVELSKIYRNKFKLNIEIVNNLDYSLIRRIITDPFYTCELKYTNLISEKPTVLRKQFNYEDLHNVMFDMEKEIKQVEDKLSNLI